jgi:putative FmdB family regulatory protein
MPIYEYFCSDCKIKFELLKPMSQSNQSASCPKCGGGAERVLSSFCRNSDGLEDSSGGSACGSCSATTCDSCSL